MSSATIIALIDSVDRTAAAIAAVAIAGSGSAPNDLVRARRTISGEIQDMNRAIDTTLVDPLMRHGSAAAAALRQSYVDRSNRARTAMADHQAKWPAIEMRNAAGLYRKDVERLHHDQRDYRRWLKLDFVPQAAALLAR